METILLNETKYNVLKIFSKSSQSNCYLIEKDNDLKVLKLYLTDEYVKPNIQITEIRKRNKHENILNVFESGFDKGRFYEITEYCSGETLLEKMPITSIEDLKTIIYQINEALNYCHSNGFMFFDIKPANIFFKTNSIESLVFGDFGSSAFFVNKEDFLISNLSKPWYSPPETHLKYHQLAALDKSFDYYTLGIMIIELLTGDNQLKYFDNSTLLELKINEKIDLSKIEDSRCITLISNLIKSKANQRWLYNDVNNWCADTNYNVERHEQICEQNNQSKHQFLKSEALRKKKLEINEIEKKFKEQYSFVRCPRQKQLLLDEKINKVSKINIIINEIENQ